LNNSLPVYLIFWDPTGTYWSGSSANPSKAAV
jgi:hypothetical protein